ncbi:MAG TPA: hypothetical protein PLO06_11435 [Methanoregulaceae archaeon]|nr:hypothetical protein [Methanoregulaceae archaeon]
MRKKTDKIVRTWKASPEDMQVLGKLRAVNVEQTESDCVRAGLRALAREKRVK